MQVESIHNIFRAYDIRGIVGTEITDELSLNIGCAFGSYILNKDKLLHRYTDYNCYIIYFIK